VTGTAGLLEAAREVGVRRFLHVSTDEVYGSLGAEGAFTESSPIRPSSPYSASKASSDLLALSYRHTYGLPVIVTRCSNNYGPYQFPEKLIPLMITQALADRPLPVYGDGMNVRDWIHVEDHCRAIMRVLEAGRAGEVYNIGAKQEKPNLHVVKRILEILEKPEGLIEFVTDRLGHDRRYAIDNTKVETELGWTPAWTFDAGLEQTVRWYLDNRAWWQALRERAGDFREI
jgi:dTDP-glucose 4,6-dehydratase